MSLVPVDTSSEVAVTSYLTHARDWLAQAVETTGPENIAAAKAEIATAAEATKQLGLSKEIQLDAQEMVRRAEYALGKSIRKGQAEGTIAKRGDIGGTPPNAGSRGHLHKEFSHATDFASNTELHGNPTKGAPGILAVADLESEDFEEALSEAKSEGNLSRANVVRKVKGQPADSVRKSRAEKADLLEELAAQGYSSRQMCKALDYARDDQVRELAREYGITIPADKQVGRSRRINSTDVVVNTATALEGLVMGVELVDHTEVDPAVASQWVDSLTESMRVLNRFVRQIKETTQ